MYRDDEISLRARIVELERELEAAKAKVRPVKKPVPHGDFFVPIASVLFVVATVIVAVLCGVATNYGSMALCIISAFLGGIPGWCWVSAALIRDESDRDVAIAPGFLAWPFILPVWMFIRLVKHVTRFAVQSGESYRQKRNS